MHEGVVEGSEYVSDTEDVLPFRGLGAQVQGCGVVQLGCTSSLCLFRWVGKKEGSTWEGR